MPRITSWRGRALALAALALLAVAVSQVLSRGAPSLSRRVHRVMLVSIDGLRPDVLLRADAPVLRGLMERGSFSMWARTTDVAITLPSHTSMLTGVPPEKHGILWNRDPPPAGPLHPSWPTLFGLAHAAGYTTAMVAGKSKFVALAVPGTLDSWWAPANGTITDQAVTDTAVLRIERARPQVLFVHLPGPDTAGHEKDWGSPEQLAAVAVSDRSVGRLLEALRRAGVLDSTLILVTADHGGSGHSHGANDMRSRYIPWILAGPGVRPNWDLTRDRDLEVRTEDTFATLCWALGIVPQRPVDGRPITQAFTETHVAARP